MDNLTKAYLSLLAVFVGVLVAGSVKTILYPDEMVYAPGRAVVVYDPATEQFMESYIHKALGEDSPAHSSFLKASLFADPKENNHNCQ